MTALNYAMFDTAIGCCGIAWGDEGVAAVQLPEAGKQQTRSRLRQQFPLASEMPPGAVIQAAIVQIAALIQGEKADLSKIVLDMRGLPPFHQRVYQLARGIVPGTTLTYGEIAAQLGTPGAARAVGQALGKNPFAIVVPCHRVLAAGGRIGGFSAGGGVITKQRLLEIEGALAPGGSKTRKAVAGKKPADNGNTTLPLFDKNSDKNSDDNSDGH